MSVRGRPLSFGVSQDFQGCQVPCTGRKSQAFRRDWNPRALLPLERVQKSGKLHMTMSKSPKIPETVLSWGSQVLNGLSSVIMTQPCLRLPEGCEANSLAQHLLILVDWRFLMKIHFTIKFSANPMIFRGYLTWNGQFQGEESYNGEFVRRHKCL